MSILFRCPCGRSMVVESDKAGAVVMCPNCRRRLRVPSGKGRGVEIQATQATAARTSRRCPRCRKDVPVDSQMCPHCQTILMDEAPKQAEPVDKDQRMLSALATARTSQSTGGIVYGGARGSWFTRLTPGGRAGVLIGGGVFVLLLFIIFLVMGLTWTSGQIEKAREQCRDAIAKGRVLETQGLFQEAYDLYSVPTDMIDALRESGEPGDAELAAALNRRATGLQYVVPRAKVFGSVYWKPTSQAEFDEAMTHLRASYPAYRQLCLNIADAGLAAVKAGKEDGRQPEFQAKVTETVEAYMRLIDQTTEQQRSQFTFRTLTQSLAELGAANRHWNDNERTVRLNGAEQYLLALKERVSKPDYPDAIW
ncbi:MAG: hypothetical protein ISS74_04395 [Planctomycetes bacterium]|nr:hypothetical protein [Planctomycetota bacterium]